MDDKPTRSEAIKAKCHDCCGEYIDGKDDCGNPYCPLYSFMPYKKGVPNLEWKLYNHSVKGKVLKSESAREYTDEQRAAAAERLRSARERKVDDQDTES